MAKKYAALAATLLFAFSTSVQANVVEIYPSDTSWQNLPAEIRDGATSQITSTAPRSGNGSLEMIGQRSRFATGTIYPTAGSTQIALLSQVTGLTFDWMLAEESVRSYHPPYKPALRLHVWDAGAGLARQLVWEGAYNNTYNTTALGQWYSTSTTDNFYMIAEQENFGKSVAAWAAELAPGSFVTGISVGVGGGAGLQYHAFAGNVTLHTTGGSTTYNFELGAAVPEPASWLMMIAGFGLIGSAMRRRTVAVAFA